MDLLSITDLVHRWIYTRQGVWKLRKRDDFPRPVPGQPPRAPRWREADIEAYEKDRPELKNERLKRRKVASFARCYFKKQASG